MTKNNFISQLIIGYILTPFICIFFTFNKTLQNSNQDPGSHPVSTLGAPVPKFYLRASGAGCGSWVSLFRMLWWWYSWRYYLDINFESLVINALFVAIKFTVFVMITSEQGQLKQKASNFVGYQDMKIFKEIYHGMWSR